MAGEVRCPTGPDAGGGPLSPEVAACMRVGRRLATTTVAERDLAWHVAAYHVGDLSALVSARLHELPTRG